MVENMTQKISKLTTNLWFNNQAEEAANFYTSVFPNSRIGKVTRYGEMKHELEGLTKGDVMTIEFTLEGQNFVGLNGGPQYQFTEAISFIINCDSQEEVDYYWGKLTEGADEKHQVCGWLKDRFGVSWQVVPTVLNELLTDSNSDKVERVTAAMFQMKKLNLHQLLQAYNAI